MNLPNVRTSVKDPGLGVTFHVVAYRRVTPAEFRDAIAYHLSHRRRRTKLKRGTHIEVHTIIGFDDR